MMYFMYLSLSYQFIAILVTVNSKYYEFRYFVQSETVEAREGGGIPPLEGDEGAEGVAGLFSQVSC